MPINLSPTIQSWLTSRIDSFANDPEETEYLREHASRHLVLPLAIDWTGFWGLRSDGEILLVYTEEEQQPVVESEDRIRRMALFQGAKRYTELGALVPTRSPAARDCPHCLGTGIIDPPGIEPGTIVCYCGGLGWVE